jgi:Kef-type K+ transport system membrane component KefB
VGGVILGAFFSFYPLDLTEFELLAKIGILFLLFISGLQTSFSKLKRMGRVSLLVAMGGIVVPLLFGLVTGLYIFSYTVQDSMVLGLILIATSVGVTARTLMDLHALNTKLGATILGSAVIDDVLGIVILAFFLGIESPLNIGLKIAIFFLIFLYLGLKVMDKILDLGEKIHLPKAFLSISLAVFLLFVYFADKCGIAGIIGAFVAGLTIGHTLKYRKIINDVQTIGYGFFIPLFFVWIGVTLWTNIDLSSLMDIGMLAIAIIIVGILGKIVGCGIAARIAGMTNIDSLRVGIGMVPRMELALIIATTAISQGLISTPAREHQILVATVLLTIVTTFITPFLIRAVLK